MVFDPVFASEIKIIPNNHFLVQKSDFTRQFNRYQLTYFSINMAKGKKQKKAEDSEEEV